MYLLQWCVVILSAQCVVCWEFWVWNKKEKTTTTTQRPTTTTKRAEPVTTTRATTIAPSASTCIENGCVNERVIPTSLNNTISSTVPTFAGTLPSTYNDQLLKHLPSPTATSTVTYRIPWWAGAVLVLGVLVAILGAFLSAKWALRQARTCRSCHHQFPQENIKVRHVNVPHLQITPDIIPENTPSNSDFNSTQQRTLPIATPTRAECVIELKSYMNRFQAPYIPKKSVDYPEDHELDEQEKVCGSQLKLDDFCEGGYRVHENTQHMNWFVDSSSTCVDNSVLDNGWYPTPKHSSSLQDLTHGRCLGDTKGISSKSSADIPTLKNRPRAPSPPRLMPSGNVRENSLYEPLGGDQHVYATPNPRPTGASELPQALREHVHMYEEPPNYPDHGMVSATSTDFLFKPSS